MNNAVQAAVSCNALGIVICDWSLPGHVNPLSVSIPAFLAGAGLAWKASLDLVSFLFGFCSHRIIEVFHEFCNKYLISLNFMRFTKNTICTLLVYHEVHSS